MKPPKTLQQAIQFFSEYENCRQFMIQSRWPDGVVRCPYCGATKLTYLEKAKLYRCYGDHPKQKFSLKVGTVFEDSPIALEKWLMASWMIANCRNGVSSYELSRAIGVTQKSAWFMLHRIRLAMQESSKTPLGGNGMPVEVDETFIGGKARNMHLRRKRRMKAYSDGAYPKAVVVGMLERKGKVRAQVIPERTKLDVQTFVKEHAAIGAEVITDEFKGYEGLPDDIIHRVVNHAETYVRQHIHTQGIENFWSLLKRGLNGTYVAVEPFHLFRYIDEQAFRFNNRRHENKSPVSDAERFSRLMNQVVGKRLTFEQVTGKVEETPF